MAWTRSPYSSKWHRHWFPVWLTKCPPSPAKTAFQAPCTAAHRSAPSTFCNTWLICFYMLAQLMLWCSLILGARSVGPSLDHNYYWLCLQLSILSGCEFCAICYFILLILSWLRLRTLCMIARTLGYPMWCCQLLHSLFCLRFPHFTRSFAISVEACLVVNILFTNSCYCRNSLSFSEIVLIYNICGHSMQYQALTLVSVSSVLVRITV